METENPSTPTRDYDWSGHINNDPPQNDDIRREEDPDSEQGTEETVEPTFEEIDRLSLIAIEKNIWSKNSYQQYI